MDEYSELTEMVGAKTETKEELYKSFPQRCQARQSICKRCQSGEVYRRCLSLDVAMPSMGAIVSAGRRL